MAVLAAACGGDDDGGDAGLLDAAMPSDGMVDGAPTIPDGSVRCEMDVECDDGVACTRDSCDGRGVCRNIPDTGACDDGVFCNGVEICDRIMGCMMGDPQACNDDDVCTLDRCLEEEKMCLHLPRDFDEDGEVDWHCEGGTDCDDRDPTRGMSLPEICDDGIDNDCDGFGGPMSIEDPDGCSMPDHDACDDPLDVSAGGRFVLNNGGAVPNYGSTCASLRRDLVLTFTLTEESSVEIEADGPGFSGVFVQTTCGDQTSEVGCDSGFPATFRSRSLAAGTYFAIVNDSSVGDIVVDVEIGPPVMPATNQTCASPLDVSGGGTFTGDFVDVSNDYSTSCGGSSDPDLVYSFTTTTEQDVRITLLGDGGDTMNFEVRSACADGGTALHCTRGSPASRRMHQLPAGTYYIIVQGSTFRSVGYTLTVDFLPPTPPPAGDTCADPIPLMIGARTLGTLSDKADDHETSCGFYYRDAVYSFSISERSDVAITVDGGSSFFYLSLRSTCDVESSELRCVSGLPSRARIRDLPAGTYYVLAEASRGSSFNITVDVIPPRTPVAVTGNDNCFSPHMVPATGGLFTGSTVGLANDYSARCGGMARSPDAVFQLDLAARKRVTASTEGSTFDTVLHLHRGVCASDMELYCDDDSGDGPTSYLDQTLDAGTWFYVVDGFSTSSTGDYTFEVLVSDP